MQALIFATLLSLLTVCYCQHTNHAVERPNPTQKYPHVAELEEGKYFLYWAFNDDRITFEVHVRTHGWVGLGFTNNGGMKGADIVIGWIKNGETYFKVSNCYNTIKGE